MLYDSESRHKVKIVQHQLKMAKMQISKELIANRKRLRIFQLHKQKREMKDCCAVREWIVIKGDLKHVIKTENIPFFSFDLFFSMDNVGSKALCLTVKEAQK